MFKRDVEIIKTRKATTTLDDEVTVYTIYIITTLLWFFKRRTKTDVWYSTPPDDYPYVKGYWKFADTNEKIVGGLSKKIASATYWYRQEK